jgi:hypothetical protein
VSGFARFASRALIVIIAVTPSRFAYLPDRWWRWRVLQENDWTPIELRHKLVGKVKKKYITEVRLGVMIMMMMVMMMMMMTMMMMMMIMMMVTMILMKAVEIVSMMSLTSGEH